MTDDEVVQMLVDEIELIGSMKDVHLSEYESLKLYMSMKNILILINKLNSKIEKLKKNAKLETVEEFARKLKCGIPQEAGVIRCIDVDNLVKEWKNNL